jgi:hypothetical protein
MNLGIYARERLQSGDAQLAGQAALDQFQKTHGALQAWSEVEHLDDGTHGAITAASIVVAGDATVHGDATVDGDLTVEGDVTLTDLVVENITAEAIATDFVVPKTPSNNPTVNHVGAGANPWAEVAAYTFRATTSVVIAIITLAYDLLNGAMSVSAHVTPSADASFDLGANGMSVKRWRNGYFSTQVVSPSVLIDGSLLTYDSGSDALQIAQTHVRPAVDNTFDMGISGATWRNGFFGNNVSANGGEVYAGLYFREASRATPVGWFTSYTPVWAGTTTNPTIGNGTLAGDYTIVGNTYFFRIVLTIGSTTTPATGIWTFTTPTTPLTTGTRMPIGQFWAGNIGVADFGGNLLLEANQNFFYCMPFGGAYVSDLVPFTWGTGDVLTIEGWYRGA